MKAVFKHYRRPRQENDVPLGNPEYPGSLQYPQAGGSVYHYQRGISKWAPAEHGGATFCYLYEGEEVLGTGLAVCSKKDAFNYAIGRAIAYGRALKAAGIRR